MIRAGVYVRKSSDDTDRDAEAQSCQRQIDAATRYATEQGWTVDPRHVYRDDAVSGAEWKHRDGWNRLLADLEPAPPFARLIVSELSRIGRDSVRTPAAILAVEEAGVEIHGYLNRSRITLSDEAGEMSTTLQSLLASFERRRTSDRTSDALRRRFEAGAACGGAAFGYVVERNGGPYAHYAIEPNEAATVRQIFQWYDEGDGLGRIVKRLNASGVAAPRSGAKGWSVASLGLLLRRPLYVGVRTRYRSKAAMRKGTKVQRATASETWRAQPAPELAIVDRELFDRVQARIEQRAASFIRSQGGRLIGRPRFADATDAAYLLTGLLSCVRCGSALGPVAPGRRAGRRAYYSCSTYHRRGVRGCGNGLRVDVKALDAAVLDAVARALDADTVAAAVRGAVEILTAGQADTATRRATIAAELATIAQRERRLLDALVDGDAAVSASIKGRLRDELARRDTLAAELASLETAAPVDVEALVQKVTARAADLRGLLGRHPMQARQVVRLLLGGSRWSCEPFDNTEGRGYNCEATGDYRRLGIQGLNGFTVGDISSGMLRPPHVPAAGRASSTRSSGVRRSCSPVFQPCGTQLPWLIIAPLGNEVVPEV
jgi:site-specific DNA recombinase